jgi:hypothetical protein
LKRIEGGPFLRLRGVLAAFAILFEAVVRNRPRVPRQLDRENFALGTTRGNELGNDKGGRAVTAASGLG